MNKFDSLYDGLISEFYIKDRNDPTFYDYIIIFLQQLIKRNLLDPDEIQDVRREAMKIVKDGYYIYTDSDVSHNVSLKINFDFDGRGNDINNLRVRIKDLVNLDEPVKSIDNTFEEESVAEIADYIESKKAPEEEEGEETPGEEVPAEVGETPSELPGATPPAGEEVPGAAPGGRPQPADTGKYLQGL